MASSKDALRLYGQLKKAVEAHESEEDKIRILDVMEKFPMTADVLMETKIAKLLNELRPKLDLNAADKCKKICIKWRKVFESAKSMETSSDSGKSPISTSAGSARGPTVSSPSITTASNLKSPTTPPPSSRTATGTSGQSGDEPTKVSFEKYIDDLEPTQKVYCNLVCKTFYGEERDIIKIVTKSKEIIRVLFQTITSESDRGNKLQFILSQLRLQSNHELRANVINGHVTVPELLSFKKEDLLSPKLKRMAEQQQAKEHEKEALMNKKVYSSLFKCPKCEEYKVIAKQQQTRSADEPATVFMNCDAENCGYSWSNSDGTA